MEGDIHVLAVDDSVLDRKVVERLLKNSSYKVTAVDSAVRALEVLGMSININLIITDYCMPEMTGYDLLKRVKESSDLKEIPVVIMSSENVPSRVKMCMAEGAKEFIIKPLQLSDVKRLRGFIYQESSVSKRKNEGFQASACLKRQVVRLRPTTSPDKPTTTTTMTTRRTTTTRTPISTTTPTTSTTRTTRTRTGEAVNGSSSRLEPSSPRKEEHGSKVTNGRHGENSKAEDGEQGEKMVKSPTTREQARVVVQQSSKRHEQMKIRHSSTGINQVAQCDKPTEVAAMTMRTRFSAAAAAAAAVPADADADTIS